MAVGMCTYVYAYVYMCACVHMFACVYVQSSLTPCDPIDCTPSGSSVRGISRQGYWSWLPFFAPGDLPDAGIEPVSWVAWLGGRFFSTETPGKPYICFFCSCLAAQLCPALCDPVDCSMPGFPVLHHLPKFTQTHVHWVSDATQPSHLLSSPSPPAFNLYQQQGLF